MAQPHWEEWIVPHRKRQGELSDCIYKLQKQRQNPHHFIDSVCKFRQWFFSALFSIFSGIWEPEKCDFIDFHRFLLIFIDFP